MRGLDIKDLHDYYDFSIFIDDKIDTIRNEILSGKYTADTPLIYKLEKKLGISRHLMIPAPSDALVFQTISNELGKDLKRKSPTTKAYFSRDKSYLPLPHQYYKSSDDIWPKLWRKFQEDIFEFSKSYKYLVVSDIANYFDNIGLRELRHVISSRFDTPEEVLDLLFKIIEELSWKPDYLPFSLKGLPTINIEAPRLLAHILLFEVDEVLQELTNGSFVRWMDDINFGVDDNDTAHKVLGDVNDVLKSRGLALNLAKTKVYTAAKAAEHFFFDDNIYLDKFNDRIKEGKEAKGRLASELERKFKKHLRNSELKNWDKITKRFFTSAGNLGTTRLLKYSFNLFSTKPGIRSNILLYLFKLGYGEHTSNLVHTLIREVKRYDDVTLFMLCNLLTDWRIPRNKKSKIFIKETEKLLLKLDSNFEIYCYLWFGAKYSSNRVYFNTILNKRKIWSKDSFLSRQVTAVLPRLWYVKKKNIDNLLDDQMKKGLFDVTSVAVNVHYLAEIDSYPVSLREYLFPRKKSKVYPLQKFLILLNVLYSEKFRSDSKFKDKVYKYIDDPWYIYRLDHFYKKV